MRAALWPPWPWLSPHARPCQTAEFRRVTARSRQTGLFEAIAIALILFVQTLSSAYATGVGPVPLDAFGNPLCITSGNHSAPADGAHGGIESCCTLACTNAAPALDAPAAGGVVSAPRWLFATLSGALDMTAAGPAFASSARPRAPPVSV